MRTGIICSSAALLLLAGCVTPGGGAQRATLPVTLTGIQEVPGPGSPGATGHGDVRIDVRNARVCWDLYVRGIDTPTAAHIHRGAAGIAGPVVVTLSVPDAQGHSQGCAPVDPGLAREMIYQAFNFYANVHTRAFPNGATRGQLHSDVSVRIPRERDN
jgi:hypothetical protein